MIRSWVYISTAYCSRISGSIRWRERDLDKQRNIVIGFVVGANPNFWARSGCLYTWAFAGPGIQMKHCSHFKVESFWKFISSQSSDKRQEMIHGKCLIGLQLVRIQKFSFSLTGCRIKAKERYLSYYLPFFNGEEEKISKGVSTIWTWFRGSISDDDISFVRRAL